MKRLYAPLAALLLSTFPAAAQDKLTVLLAHRDMAADAVEQINIGWSISPALMAGQVDAGRYTRFEAFLAAQGVIEEQLDISELAIDVTGGETNE